MHIHTNCSDLRKALRDLCCWCSPVWDFSVWHVGFQWRSGLMYYNNVNATSFGVNAFWSQFNVVHFSIPIFLFSSQHFPSGVTTANELRASDPIVWIHFSCDNNFEPCFTSSINLLFSLPLDLLSHSSTDIFYPAFLNIQIISFWVLRLISKTCNMECPLSYSLLNLSIHITSCERESKSQSLSDTSSTACYHKNKVDPGLINTWWD